MDRKIIFVLVATALLLFAVSAFSSAEKKDDKVLEKVTFIHYKKNAKPVGVGKPPKGTTCYAFLASGAKWKVNEPFLVNPINDENLSDSFVFSAVNSGINEWEAYGGNIFGAGSLDYGIAYLPNYADGLNTASFGYYPNNGVIAITTVWGYFSGKTRTREIVEWDMLFNDSFNWGDSTVNGASVMDLQNIATHELGHAAGMNDLYDTSCIDETMYGYADYGETNKRALNSGDIAGITSLYG
ncbi:MAG: matrixin family metalloprotease [Candidatus Diapherotrites archaeon]